MKTKLPQAGLNTLFSQCVALQAIRTMPNVAGERNGCVFPGQEKAIRFVLTFSDVGKAIVVTPFLLMGWLFRRNGKDHGVQRTANSFIFLLLPGQGI